MPGLVIFGSARSRTARVLWMAMELKLDFEHVPFTFDSPALKADDFRRVNPNGRIPAIKDDELTLFESLAINLYLAKKHRFDEARSLYPASLEDEARAWQWSFWAIAELDASLEALRMHRTLLAEDARDPGVAQRAQAQLRPAIAALESVLRERTWLVGSRFSVADLNVASVLSPSRTALLDMTSCNGVCAWLQ